MATKGLAGLLGFESGLVFPSTLYKSTSCLVSTVRVFEGGGLDAVYTVSSLEVE